MNRKTRGYIHTLLLMLLFFGGMANGAWAESRTVTYHVITLPMTEMTDITKSGTAFRIEAIKKTVTCDSEDVIELPDDLKSPLLTDNAYSYYTDLTAVQQTIFTDHPSTFNTYDLTGKVELDANATVGDKTDIYVTYDKWLTIEGGEYVYRTAYGKKLDINGGKIYNLEFTQSNGTGSWLYAINMNPERGNRAQAVPSDAISSWGDLSADEPTKTTKTVGTKNMFYYQWKLKGNDPYNIILETAYDKNDFVYKENNYHKQSDGARFYGHLESATKIKNNWMTNEWKYVYQSTSSVSRVTVGGWYRNYNHETYKNGSNNGGVNGNGVASYLYFSLLLLKHKTANYTLVASWVDVDNKNWVPNGSDQYLHMMHTPEAAPYAGPSFVNFSNADQIRFHEIQEYTFKVKTSFYPTGGTDLEKAAHVVSANMKWSDYAKSEMLVTYAPDALKRKYAVFSDAYKEEGGDVTAISTFEDAQAATGHVVWMNYTTLNIPFEASTDYATARWYTLGMNNSTAKANMLVYDDGSSSFATSNDKDVDSHETHFAFVGDPYELLVISRKASETAAENRYVGIASNSADPSNLIHNNVHPDGYRWEIVYDNNTGSYSGNMRLREFGTGDNTSSDTPNGPRYWGVSSSMATYSSTANLIRVSALPQYTYTYNMVDMQGRIAIKHSVTQDVCTPLNKSCIPSAIFSPYLIQVSESNFSYYGTKTGDQGTADDGRQKYSFSGTLIETPAGNKDIYVRYDKIPVPDDETTTITEVLTNTPLKIDGTSSSVYNVRLNSNYIYKNSDDIGSKTQAEMTAEGINKDTDPAYKWTLSGNDPYAMTIQNSGYYTKYDPSSLTSVNSLTFETSPSSGFYFIALSGNIDGVFEVMAATGSTYDAATTSYSIGRDATNGVKLFEKATYSHGDAALRFVLTSTTASVTYYLIDKQGKVLLSQSSDNASLGLPDEWVSPLVSEYHYYDGDDMDFNANDTPFDYSDDYDCTPKNEDDEISSVSYATSGRIYVTYDVSDAVNLKGTSGDKMYRLKYLNGENFYQEDGSDNVLGVNVTGEARKAIYPYANGDMNLYIYGAEELERQMGAAASTRARWPWYLESPKIGGEIVPDPYHVKIYSNSTETNLDRQPIYLRTYKPSDYSEIVTGAICSYINYDAVSSSSETSVYYSPGDPNYFEFTEYMILGSDGHYLLRTTNEVDDGDGDPSDDVRHDVTSFEQYWKIDPTIKRLLPDAPEPAADNATLTGMGWHRYTAWARAATWTVSSKSWAEAPHWFQTIDMVDGLFDLEEMTIDPALILLDQHGWEIMRKAIPSQPATNATEQARIDALYTAIRPYNSPMVKAYHFWHKAVKATGYHKYKVSEHITVTPKDSKGNPEEGAVTTEYTSTDLTKLPPYASADNLWEVYTSGANIGKPRKDRLSDQYVTYEVKDEYAKSYDYNSGSPVASRFLVQQGTHYAKTDDGATISGVDVREGDLSRLIVEKDGLTTGNTLDPKVLWYVKPNPDIDNEMGLGDAEYGESTDRENDKEPWTKETTIADYNDENNRTKRSNGFDPYNIQIESCSNSGKYFTVPNIVSAQIGNESSMEATYSGEKSVTLASLSKKATGEGHDHTELRMTNATFMAVQDANGNMRLMPRFDHNNRVTNLTTLTAQDSDAPKNDDGSGSGQTTFLIRPLLYEYRIIDNEGREALRYRKGGENYPAIPEHMTSPFAKDFKFYKGLTPTTGGIYDEIKNGTDITEKEIIGSFASSDVISEDDVNYIYVRYLYDEEADEDRIVQGNWLTMKLNNQDVKYEYERGIVSDTKPVAVNESGKEWQWKFLKVPNNPSAPEPDPYAVQLFNRSQPDKPLSATALSEGDVTAATGQTYERYALLPHSNSPFSLSLVVAGVGEGTGNHCDTYYFLDGTDLSTSGTGKIRRETNFTTELDNFDGTKSELLLSNDVAHDYRYHVITKADVITKAGKKALTVSHDKSIAEGNGYSSILPEEGRTPLLADNAYHYHVDKTSGSTIDNGDGTYTVANGLEVESLLGLYNDDIYVSYNDYDTATTPFKVTKERNATDAGDVAPTDDELYPIDFTGKQGYNLIWLSDNMFGYTGSAFVGTADKELTNDYDYIWKFKSDNSDPYDFKIYNRKTENYLTSGTPSSFSAEGSATSFMWLKKANYAHGTLAVSGNQTHLLNGYSGNVNTDTPSKFYLFALRASLTYRWDQTATNSQRTTPIEVSVGEKNVGTTLEIPASMRRPFCSNYTYYLDAEKTGKAYTEVTDDFLGDVTVYMKYEVKSPFGYATDNSTKMWYTLETNDGDPYLANYTNYRNTLAAATGRNPHYTNDYLWAIEGDPYGFYLHNRYVTKNGNDWNKVMTTAATPADEAPLTMSTLKTNAVYEMDWKTGDTWETSPASDYFRMHPIVDETGLYVSNDAGDMSLSTTGSDWTLALNDAQLAPYYSRRSYVGGLNNAGVTAWDYAADNAAKQTVVYDDANIVKLFTDTYKPGYYRIHDTQGEGAFYVSGYTHRMGLSNSNNLHYHEEATSQTIVTYGGLPSNSYDNTPATVGDIPLVAAVYDPSSIFYFNPTSSENVYVTTQDLYVNRKDGGSKMSTTSEILNWIDIGGAVITLRPAEANTRYLAPDGTKTKTVVFGTNNELADNTKWCLQPANNLKLKLKTHDGGDGYYYGSIYMPYDVKIETADSKAFICKQWDFDIVHLKDVGRYNSSPYNGDATFVQAGTPAIVRTKDTSGEVTLSLPKTNASTPIVGNVFDGEYLEQLLGGGHTVYTFGLPYTGLTLNTSDGSVTGVASANGTKAGFYVNANYNRESSASSSSWTRNNWYVYHNKVYCRPEPAAGARRRAIGHFVPVVFDDEPEEPISEDLNGQMLRSGCVYDLQGRCVATEEEVSSGHWRLKLNSGVYIFNGKKIVVK